MDYTTVDMTVRSLLADILRTDVPPAGAVGWGFVDDSGDLISVPLGDLGGPAATGTGLASAIYEVGTSGAQTINQADATWFGDVGVRSANGKSVALDFGTGYTFAPGQLNILAAVGASLQAGDAIAYTYASGVVSGQQPAPVYTAGDNIDITGSVISAVLPEQLDPLTYPVMVAQGGTYVGYESLEDLVAVAGNANKTIILNSQLVTVNSSLTITGHLYSAGYAAILLATGITLTLTAPMRVTNINIYRTTSSTARVLIANANTTGTVPTASQAVQLADSRIGANLLFSDASQAVAARGRSTVEFAEGQPGTLYLYDLAAVTTLGTVAPAVVDRRPGAAAAGGSIDYANPVTLNSAATLAGNTAYYVTGGGYPLTLPPASANLGKAIFIEIAANATGLYPVTGSTLTVYATETMLLRATLGGWSKAGGELVPMSVRLETTPAQQNSLPQGVLTIIPFSVEAYRTGPPALTSLASNAISIQRSGRGLFALGGVIGQLSNPQGDYTLLLQRTRAGQDELLVVDFFVIAPPAGLATKFVTVTLNVQAGDLYRVAEGAGAGSAALAGQSQTNVFFLSYSELI